MTRVRIRPRAVLPLVLLLMLAWAALCPAAGPGRDMSERAVDKFLFHDPAFVFQTLWRTSMIASGGA
ncbi:MAG TPA: hypothetical protein DDW80_00255, partial [Desulfovibrio sp.]|nr:hypothetical protein [Desulfovibrio sp.]